MSDHPGYKVETITQDELDRLLSQIKNGGPENKNHRRTAVLADGFELKGEFELTARDVNTGQVDWQHKSENLITDMGRRYWFDIRLANMRIAFVPSREQPMASRSSLSTDASQAIVSANLVPSNNSATNTKTLSTTFTTPASNRTLGTIILGGTNVGVNSNAGFSTIVAYATLTPSKVQTTTQTLEVVYKISMNPIY